MTQLRVFSYGGGVQSTAALVLAAQGRIDFPVFLFANVGDDSEHPNTLRYVRDVAMPYAAAHGIALVERSRVMRDGSRRTLLEEVTSEHLASIPIPVRNAEGSVGRRSCTKHFKVLVIGKETRQRGATRANPAVLGLGISIDEYQRMNTHSQVAHQVNVFPLIDLRLTRSDCRAIIAGAGLAVPPKSACWFCPFIPLRGWQDMKANEPNIFMNAVVLERDILEKARRNKKEPLYLSGYGQPLSTALGEQTSLNLTEDDDDVCESGHCMT